MKWTLSGDNPLASMEKREGRRWTWREIEQKVIRIYWSLLILFGFSSLISASTPYLPLAFLVTWLCLMHGVEGFPRGWGECRTVVPWHPSWIEEENYEGTCIR